MKKIMVFMMILAISLLLLVCAINDDEPSGNVVDVIPEESPESVGEEEESGTEAAVEGSDLPQDEIPVPEETELIE